MNLQANRLAQSLARKLSPIYLITGDEPLQLGEAADAVRKSAKDAGFTHRELFEINPGVKWDRFSQATESLSLFGEKKILDLRLYSGKPGQDGAKVLTAYTQQPTDDTIVLIISPKLSATARKAKWVQAIGRQGIVVQVWPLEGKRLTDWLRQRMLKLGLRPDSEGLAVLADRVEGNMLAAAQEIDKLFILQGPGPVKAESIIGLVSNNARYDVYKLMDAVLQGKPERASKILFSLEREGASPSIVLWGLMKESRLLLQMSFKQKKGHEFQDILHDHNVWESRKTLVVQALARLRYNRLQQILQFGAHTDRIIKGLEEGEPWNGMLTITMALCGVGTFTETPAN